MKALLFIRDVLVTFITVSIIVLVVGGGLYGMHEGVLDCMPGPGPACSAK